MRGSASNARAPLRKVTRHRYVYADGIGINLSLGRMAGHWLLDLECSHTMKLPGRRRPPKRTRCSMCSAAPGVA